MTNHLDQEKADFDRTLVQLKETFGNKVVQIQYPITTGPQFNAVVDVLKMKMYQ